MKQTFLLYSLLIIGIVLTKTNVNFYFLVAIVLISPLAFYNLEKLGILTNIKKGFLYGLGLSLIYLPFILNKVEISAFYQFPQVFAEEIFFRGYLQTTLEERLKSPYKAILISSLMFCIPHMILFPSLTAVLTFFPSLVFGYLFYITRSIYASVIFHLFSNVFFLYAGQKLFQDF